MAGHRFAAPLRRPRLPLLSVSTSRSVTHKYPSIDALVKKARADLKNPANVKRHSPLKPIIDIQAIRANVKDLSANCLLRNYSAAGQYPARIVFLTHARQDVRSQQSRLRRHLLQATAAIKTANAELREAAALAGKEDAENVKATDETHPALFAAAKGAKNVLADNLEREKIIEREIEHLAALIPNSTSDLTPIGQHTVLTYINEAPKDGPDPLATKTMSHVDIGNELGILDFASAAHTSGWGFYFLLGAGVQLEQALIQYALAVAKSFRWTPMSAPSMVYGYIGAACGFQPRDKNDEQQVYALEQPDENRSPQHVLAGTAEIPIAGTMAGQVMELDSLPVKRAAVSRCFRAEAGGRGADTKGLYRVHEFTKVELFAWTHAEMENTTQVFDEMIDMQSEILGSLGLRCRVLEMPVSDLGASAHRKIDIEALFPSRKALPKTDGGWGELSSASICTDYQARRLETRLRQKDGSMGFPWTVNGTALAVPRVLAAILETHWDKKTRTVVVPEVLRPWMGGMERINGPKSQVVKKE